MKRQNRPRSSRRAGDGASFLGRNKGDNGSLPSAGPTVMMLDPKIILWPQERISSDPENLVELARSMADGGQEDPLIVRQLEDGSYEGAGGMNQCQAAVQSGMPQVICLVREGSHRDVVRANLRTALNRARPTPMSEVEGVGHAYHEVRLSVEEIMVDSGQSQVWVEDRLAIYNASPVVRQSLLEKKIEIGAAILLARIEDHEEQDSMTRDLLTHGWTNKQLEDAIHGEYSIEDLDAEDDLEALKYAATLVLAGAEGDQDNPAISWVSNRSLHHLREALRDYITDL